MHPRVTFRSARLSRAFATLAAVILAAVVLAPAAQAHTELKSSTPERDSTVEELTEVRLEFTSHLLDIGAELSLVDINGDAHPLEPTFPEDMVVVAAVDAELPAGTTTLVWRIVAEDGHPIEGTVPFTYAPAEADPGTPTPTAVEEPTAAAEPTPHESVSAVPISEPISAEPEPATPGWVLPLIGLAALGAAVAAVVLVVRKRG
ncbi:copper resistance CopC family protein [Demequina sp.]|uniref:copper resistance CopC family protein n=1 Tax=Demequina sp. TaxID=2050685 RepID=UPI003A8C7AFB